MCSFRVHMTTLRDFLQTAQTSALTQSWTYSVLSVWGQGHCDLVCFSSPRQWASFFSRILVPFGTNPPMELEADWLDLVRRRCSAGSLASTKRGNRNLVTFLNVLLRHKPGPVFCWSASFRLFFTSSSEISTGQKKPPKILFDRVGLTSLYLHVCQTTTKKKRVIIKSCWTLKFMDTLTQIHWTCSVIESLSQNIT